MSEIHNQREIEHLQSEIARLEHEKRSAALDWMAAAGQYEDEIARLRADIDNARLLFSDGKAFLLKEVSELITTVERSEAENAKLREALKHYASANNWEELPDESVRRVWLKPYSSTRESYNGYDIARAALGGENG